MKKILVEYNLDDIAHLSFCEFGEAPNADSLQAILEGFEETSVSLQELIDTIQDSITNEEL